jgi:hypothetical protein
MPPALGIAQPQRTWDTPPLPPRNPPDHRAAKPVVRGLPTRAGARAHGRLPAPLGFERPVTPEREHAIRGRGPRPPRRSGPISPDCLPLPWARPPPPPRGPIVQRRWQVCVEPLQGPVTRITHQRDHQPAEDQHVRPRRAAKGPRAWGEPRRYLAWAAWAPPPVSRSWAFWEGGGIQTTPARAYFQAFCGDTPAAAVRSPVTFESFKRAFSFRRRLDSVVTRLFLCYRRQIRFTR